MASEKRLIDAMEYREQLTLLLQNIILEEGPLNNDKYGVTLYCLRMLDAQDSVDAVEVVRCKDCIHWYEPEETCLKIYSDGAVSAYAWQCRKPDDFCSYGERRTDGKDT